MNSLRFGFTLLQLPLLANLLGYRINSLFLEFVLLTHTKLCELLSVEAIPESYMMIVNLHLDIWFGNLEILRFWHKIFDFRAKILG